jgi:hypothetical protein
MTTKIQLVDMHQCGTARTLGNVHNVHYVHGRLVGIGEVDGDAKISLFRCRLTPL